MIELEISNCRTSSVFPHKINFFYTSHFRLFLLKRQYCPSQHGDVTPSHSGLPLKKRNFSSKLERDFVIICLFSNYMYYIWLFIGNMIFYLELSSFYSISSA